MINALYSFGAFISIILIILEFHIGVYIGELGGGG